MHVLFLFLLFYFIAVGDVRSAKSDAIIKLPFLQYQIEAVSVMSQYPQDGGSVYCCYDHRVYTWLLNCMVHCVLCVIGCVMSDQGLFPGGMGGPPIWQKFCQSPIRHLSPFLDQGLSPLAEVRPWKFEKFKYIFVSNLTTFKLKSTLKSCISCLK